MTQKTDSKSLLDELQWRGLIFQRTHEEELDQQLENPTTLYCGFDPTSASMQIGNLLLIITLARFRMAGHKPIALAGGATGLIGDPSGKKEERQLQTEEQILKNTESLGNQLRTILDRAMIMHGNKTVDDLDPIPIVNNADWIKPWSFLTFLRDVGKHFRVGTLLSRDSVKTRLESEQGLSYTEFSYQLIQSYDFKHLYKEFGCVLQIGGSDQWGNIISGTDFIRRIDGGTAFGLTLPLITDAEGRKFGKSEGNAVYLSAEFTSPYTFYQFWINQDDAIVIDLIKKYTFLTKDEVDALAATIDNQQNRGEVQQKLAYEVTRLVHGQEEADAAVRASQMLFGEKIEGLNDRQLSDIFANVPSFSIERKRLEEGIPAIDLFSEAFGESKSAIRRVLQQGGGYVNNNRLEEKEDAVITIDQLATETKLVLRSGRKKYCVVECV